MIVFTVSRVFHDMAMSPKREVHTLREQVAQLLADNTHLKAQLQEVLTLVGQLRGTIETQQAHIAKLVKMTFGPKSERVKGPTLFDDLPDEPVASPIAPLITEPKVLVPRRKGHGRKPNPATLPRQREVIDLCDTEKVCPCCAEVRVRIGETIRERLDYTPSAIFVREIAQQTYACRSCEKAAREHQIASPAFPPEPVPKSGVGAGLLAQVIVSKYIDHLPLYRQESIFARQGWPVPRTRLCDLVGQCAKLLDVAVYFPDGVRLFIHPQPAHSEKVGILLTPAEDAWLTPWHGAVLLRGDRFVLTRRAEAEAMGTKVVERAGQPSHFELPAATAPKEATRAR